VYKIGTATPNDVSGLDRLIQKGEINPNSIVGVIGKTEGNGCVNDFTRGYAVSSLQAYLAPQLKDPSQVHRIVYVMSGGTEGVLSPHLTVFTRTEVEEDTIPTSPSLSIGIHHTRDFLVNEVGTRVMIEEVAKGVKSAMKQAGISSEADVHFVQIKCPLVRAADQEPQGDNRNKMDSYKSMAMSRGASALGVALALEEVTEKQLGNGDDVICQDYRLFSKVASTSAGSELRNCEIMVLGNSPESSSDFVIGHDVMQHALDTSAITRAVQQSGGTTGVVGMNDSGNQLVNILCKAEASPTGQILGCRHTMLDDSDISHTRMARAVVAAVVASIVQDPMVYVSGGAEHQGPPGGGPVAAICRRRR
jgi:cyanuric acid amidohydrolase